MREAPRPIAAIERLQAYDVASQDVWRIDDPTETLKLDWNEATVVDDAVRRSLIDLLSQPGIINWYPDVGATRLCKAIAKRLGCSPMEVLVFGGSDVALETIARVYVTSGDKVAVISPGYDNFRPYAQACGAEVIQVPSSNGKLDFCLDFVLDQVRSIGRLRLLYLISPNNPCGYIIHRSEAERLAEVLGDTIIIIDEAYVEFAPPSASLVPLIEHHPNILVTRSFSKAYGLAGLRIGYVLSRHGNLRFLSRIRNGKNVSMLAQHAALFLVEHPELLERRVHEVCAARCEFSASLRSAGIAVHEGHGNFVLVEAHNTQDAISFLKESGVYVRSRDQVVGRSGMIRITIGTREQMRRVSALVLGRKGELFEVRHVSETRDEAAHVQAVVNPFGISDGRTS